MKKMQISKSMALAAFLAGASVCACSVKEDREDCPCWLQLDLSECSLLGKEVHLKGWTSERNVLGDTVYEDDFGALYEAEVPRGTLDYCAYAGMENARHSGMTIIIPEGKDMDPVHAYRSTVLTEGETAYDKVHLHKQYADVTFRFEDSGGRPTPGLSISVEGGWAGIDLRTLVPVKGRFLYSPSQDKDGSWSFRLPRQGDDSLLLNIFRFGEPVDIIELGAAIERMGYDWTAADLDDILITVDWALGTLSVRIAGWEEGRNYTEDI